MIKPGEEWGTPTSAAPDLEIDGGDADLAAAAERHPGALIRFRPGPASDLAGAVGLDRAVRLGVELPLDLLRIDGEPPRSAVNMVVLGTPPVAPSQRIVRRFVATVRVDGHAVFAGRCTAVVIATGQFRRGLDLVPRGHPGDGRAEVQIYAVRAARTPRAAAPASPPEPTSRTPRSRNVRART